MSMIRHIFSHASRRMMNKCPKPTQTLEAHIHSHSRSERHFPYLQDVELCSQLERLRRKAYAKEDSLAVGVYHAKSICMGLSFHEPTALKLLNMYSIVLYSPSYAAWWFYGLPAQMRFTTMMLATVRTFNGTNLIINIPNIMHVAMIRLGLAESEKHVAMLITLYGKVGNSDTYTLLFERLGNKGLLAWTSFFFADISSHPKRAISTFTDMENAGIKPTHQIFRGVLTAYVRSGENHVEEARLFLLKMKYIYKVTLNVTHYTFIVDKILKTEGIDKALTELEVTKCGLSDTLCNMIFGRCASVFEVHTYDISSAARMADLVIRDGGTYRLNYTAYSRLEEAGFVFPASIICMPRMGRYGFSRFEK